MTTIEAACQILAAMLVGAAGGSCAAVLYVIRPPWRHR